MSLARWGCLSEIDLKAFYTLRFARIIPSLILVLALIVVLGCLEIPYFANTDGGHNLPSSYFFVAIVSVLTFWHNVLMQQQGWFNYCLNIYWSLSVEEVFYLALPVACLLIRRTFLLVVVCAVLIFYGPIYRAAHLDNGLFWECGYAACFDSIALGCLAALLSRHWSPAESSARVIRALTLIGIAVIYLRGIDGHEVLGFTALSLCTAGFLVASSGTSVIDASHPLWTWPIRWAGQHSYELYLFHIVVLALMRNVFARGQLAPIDWALWLVLFCTVSGGIAYFVAAYVSEPANRGIRARFWNTRSDAPGRV
jgi:peptidoglycan/LPS O-acetylase OafA/YrhL